MAEITILNVQRPITPKTKPARDMGLVFCMSFHRALHEFKVSWKYLRWFSNYRADMGVW